MKITETTKEEEMEPGAGKDETMSYEKAKGEKCITEENQNFLNNFYQAFEVSHDSLGQSLARTFFSGGKRGRLGELARDLQEEGGAKDVVLKDDFFEADMEDYRTGERRKLTKRTKVSLFFLLVLIPLTIFIGFHIMDGDSSVLGSFLDNVFSTRKYYFISLIIMIYALIPFFMVFEGRKPQARELIVLATLAALATAGRGAFFMLPHFKPMIAIVIISGIAFGGEAGFLVGAVTMLVSNFLFGQGPWTPWQMFAAGFIGFLSGILHRVGLLPVKRFTLCIYGFLVTLFIYGGIMNPAALVMSVYEFTWEGLLAVYISGIPVDLVHASSTFIFLWLGAEPLLEKLQRIKVKYGLL